MLDVGGYRLATRLQGTDRPTVVLISGLDTPMDVWTDVEAGVRGFGTVLAYDRAGVGASELAPGSRHSEAIALELHRLLSAARLRPPYLLVAHSLGGIHARVFAGLYPSEVAGLVLVDASHEDQLDLVPNDVLEEIAGSLTYSGARAELLAQPQSTAQVRAAGALPQVPLAVLTGMKLEDGETAESKQAWYDLHHEWVEEVADAIHLTTTRSGHLIPAEEPDFVVNAIRVIAERIGAGSVSTSGATR